MLRVGRALLCGVVVGCSYTPPTNVDSTDSPQPSCVEPPSGIVSWWDGEILGLDIITGETAGVLGTPTIADGIVGKAARFAATDVLVVDRPPTPTQFTIETWVFLEVGLTGDWIGFYGRFTEASFTAFDNRLAYWDGTFGGTTGNLAVATTSLVGAWHHLAITWDGTTIRSYVDGVLEGMQPPAGVAALPTRPSAIGGLLTGPGNDEIEDPFVGSIDELTIYNRALTNSEVATIAMARAGKCKP